MAGLKSSASQTNLHKSQDEQYLNFVVPAAQNRDSFSGILPGKSLSPKARYDLNKFLNKAASQPVLSQTYQSGKLVSHLIRRKSDAAKDGDS